jgi:hypothetical protein
VAQLKYLGTAATNQNVIEIRSKLNSGNASYYSVQNVSSSELSKSLKIGRPRRRWNDNIIMDLREIGCDGVK